MAFAIKAEIADVRARTFEFFAQKTMYSGKRIAKGDVIFVFASENEGGQGLRAASSWTPKVSRRSLALLARHRG